MLDVPALKVKFVVVAKFNGAAPPFNVTTDDPSDMDRTIVPLVAKPLTVMLKLPELKLPETTDIAVFVNVSAEPKVHPPPTPEKDKVKFAVVVTPFVVNVLPVVVARNRKLVVNVPDRVNTKFVAGHVMLP